MLRQKVTIMSAPDPFTIITTAMKQSAIEDAKHGEVIVERERCLAQYRS